MEKSQQKLTVKPIGYYITGGSPIAKGLCYDTYLYSDENLSAIKSTSKSL